MTRIALVFPFAVPLALAVTFALGGCAVPQAPAVDELVLKAYDVPVEHAAELQGIIAGLLWTGKDAPRQGAAALTPSGQLLVSAPAGFHPGIADVVARLKAGPAARAPSVTLDYWVVVAAPAAAPTPGASVAPEIGAALDALEKSQGNLKLGLLERLKLSSQTGSQAHAEGALMRADQTVALHGEKVVAQLSLRRIHGDGGIDTRVEIPLGETVVLGQAGTTLGNGACGGLCEEAAKGPLTAFYVVRASVDAK